MKTNCPHCKKLFPKEMIYTDRKISACGDCFINLKGPDYIDGYLHKFEKMYTQNSTELSPRLTLLKETFKRRKGV